LTRVSWNNQTAATAEDQFSSVPQVYEFGDNRIDFGALIAHGEGGEIKLTPQEAKLLKLFIINRGMPLSRDKLLEIGWGYARGTSTRTVDNYLVRFRKYFEKNSKKPLFFKSLRSVGYIFDHDVG
jgi:DNA-binding response OmpR family regulator